MTLARRRRICTFARQATTDVIRPDWRGHRSSTSRICSGSECPKSHRKMETISVVRHSAGRAGHHTRFVEADAMMIVPDGFGARVWRHPAVAHLKRLARAKAALLFQIVLVVFLIVQMTVSGEMLIARQWALFALHALTFPLRMWNVDGEATLLASLSYMAKLALALMPTMMLVWCTPKWRILACLFAALVLVSSVSFVRACPVRSDWVVLVVSSGLGTLLVRRRFLRWAAALPVIVLVVLPAVGHGNARHFGATLAARCAANEGERATNLDPSQFAPRYYGVHFFPPELDLAHRRGGQRRKFHGQIARWARIVVAAQGSGWENFFRRSIPGERQHLDELSARRRRLARQIGPLHAHTAARPRRSRTAERASLCRIRLRESRYRV